MQALQQEANGGTVTALNATEVQAGNTVEFSVCKGELARAASTDDGFVHPIQRPDLPRVFKLLDGNRLESDLVLLTSSDMNDVLSWTVEDQGDKIDQRRVTTKKGPYWGPFSFAYCGSTWDSASLNLGVSPFETDSTLSRMPPIGSALRRVASFSM